MDRQESLLPPRRRTRWGVVPVTLGLCAAVGVPVFDTVTWVPGYVQGPILQVGQVTAVAACLTGAAVCLIRRERLAGIIGVILGVLAYLLVPSLARA